MDKKKCFVAYPSKPPDIVEAIENSIKVINRGQVVNMVSWKDTGISGRIAISSICEAINECAIFICDLTYFNHNVLFELGYAIAKNKKIWVLLNPSIKGSEENYKKFKFLRSVIFASYNNARDIEDKFYKEAPYDNIDKTVFNDAIKSALIPPSKINHLLYLKSDVETDASIELSRRVDLSKIPIILDDPKEVRFQTLSWYAQNTYNAFAVIVHFLSNDHAGHELHNAKNAFVSGLAYGFGKHLLMIAHEPYCTPIDYDMLLKTHDTAMQCKNISNLWLTDLEKRYTGKIEDTQKYTEVIRGHAELQNIMLGEFLAENEKETLDKYFIETAAFNEALKSCHSVFIGRKGSGKTANFYQLIENLSRDKHNQLCIIKPVGYELEGILSMLTQTMSVSEKGYLIESFWKFLIYTELAKSVYESIECKPIYISRTAEEESLCEYVKRNESIILPEFSIRLEAAIKKLQNINPEATAKEQRAKISELLHGDIISKIRVLIGVVLEEKIKVAVLVDNLDKAWKSGPQLEILSELLFGLLRVSRDIFRDFERSNSRLKPVKIALILFLRSDIFSYAIKYARERDKISYYRIIWDDPGMLIRVLEERLLNSGIATPTEIWSKYFCANVKGINVKNYLIERILPRPRDIIFLAKIAINNAINRRHTKIEEDDILDAEKEYSHYALESILVENGIRLSQLESLLYEFVGSSVIIEDHDILEAMKKCIIPEAKLTEIIDLLIELTFIGQEIDINRFEFLYNEDFKNKFQAMSRRLREKSKNRRFMINKPFHSYLEIR